ncbi:DNA mismatch repair protein Msh2-like isoform X1 [Portunus trituberculatus]|uniref:DNA mismatch repair protein Msh2-like isoform X1 n=2 Tax=Portunus trituberculatus TaxID=210409 RepID=UPI001E1CE2A8|nr:DNA mismatch repair protein Msh2-like isoform X1 [Portunus trituberculatus]
MATVQAKEQPTLDGANEQGFLSFFRNLPEKPHTTVRVFDRGEYYTVHGQDALLAARDLFRTHAVVKLLGSGSNKVESVVLSRLNFESFMRDLLLVKHYRVEVYKSKSASKNDWEIEYKASPGNLSQLEEVLFGASTDRTITTGVMAVKVAPDGNQKVVGVGYIDVGGQEIRLAEFSDTEAFCNLEALVVQLSPRECLLPSGDHGPTGVKLKQVMSRNPLLVTERKRSDFNNKDAEQDLRRLLRKSKGSASASLEQAGAHATAALTAVIKYLELLSDESNFGQFSLKPYDLSQYMRLDAAAVRALHVEPVDGGREGAGAPAARTHSLLGLLDKCRTSLGHRLMLQWLRQPLVDINKIEERLDLVEALVSSVQLRHSLGEDHLRQIPDLNRFTRRLTRKEANLQDCYRFYRCVERLPNLCDAVARYDGPHTTSLAAVFTTPLQEIISDLAKFQEMIETTMDLEQCNKGEFVIKADFDDGLTELRETMDSLEEQIQGQVRKVANDLCLEAGKSLKLESTSQLGYHYRITLKEEKVLRNNRNYTVIDTNKTGVRFRNGALQDLNEQHLAAKEEYALQQKVLVEEIIGIAVGYVEVIQSLGQVLAVLDCTHALASAAVSAPVPYVRPRLLAMGSGMLRLEGMRHPCLEMQDEVSFIPNDCSLGNETGRFHIITGPNMGGKSTFLRSVGVAVLMAQVGSFVSCQEAEVSIVDSILARVGAGDNQQRGVSTFMAEMLETSTILRSASENSLILIDELGRGTSTYDGFGLAWALSEHIAKEIRSFTLFATHFHEVTALGKEVDSVKNFHVTATTAHGTLTLLYLVRPGPCDRSFGIHVAELANFPATAIEFARQKAREMEDDFGDVEDDSEEAVKKRKLQKEEGEKVIEEFLAKISKLDCDALNDEELEKEVEKLREEARSHNNPYIAHLMPRET